jgi:glucose-1-phosphate thymidylyltransferase
MRGLICAGGEATRLGELTRATNKHLLPVGSWPMVYYPLQLLQLAGIHEVLVVTGKHHAGQMIDLLGDGRLASRGGGGPLLDLDLTYKVQTEAGGIAQVVGMAREFAGDQGLVVVLGDNIFERAQSEALRAWGAKPDVAQIFVKAVPDPESFGVVVYGDDGRVIDIVENGQAKLMMAGSGVHEAASQAAGMVYGTVQRQALMLAFIDNFHMLGIVFFIVIPVLMFLKRPPKGASAPVH